MNPMDMQSASGLAGMDTMTATVEKRNAPAVDCLGRQDATIDELELQVNRLATTLAFVLNPNSPPAAPQPNGEGLPSVSPIVQNIADHTDRIGRVVETVRELIARVEV